VTDHGYFPRGESVLRMVQEEKSVGLFYGQRALAIGAIAPLNFIGTRRHTARPERPFKRLVATAKMFEAIMFGTRAEADKVLGAVHGMHARVRGEIPRDEGPFKAGTPYSAFDPELMLWTVAVAADSARVFYELFVRRLTDDERDALWADYARFGSLFGMPLEVAPGSHREFKAWFDGRVAAEDSFLTEEACHTGRAVLLSIPVPASRWAPMRAHNVIQIAMLPPRVRALYGLEYTPAMQSAFRALMGISRATRPLAPRRLRYGSCNAEFDLVARTERRLHERGRPIPGALAPN
jgi:uncharacterized protein (DUF2236 family)